MRINYFWKNFSSFSDWKVLTWSRWIFLNKSTNFHQKFLRFFMPSALIVLQMNFWAKSLFRIFVNAKSFIITSSCDVQSLLDNWMNRSWIIFPNSSLVHSNFWQISSDRIVFWNQRLWSIKWISSLVHIIFILWNWNQASHYLSPASSIWYILSSIWRLLI